MPRISAKIGDQELRYEYPEVSTSQTTRTSTHEPVGKRPVIQYHGPGSMSISIHGHCYLDTANYLRSLDRNNKIRIRTQEFDGMGILEDLSISPEGAKGGVPPNKNQPRDGKGNPNDWRYEFDLSATQVQGEANA